MVGKLSHLLSAGAILAVGFASVHAQTAPEARDSSPTPGKRPGWFGGNRPTGPEAAALENVRKALDALTPEQRKRFQENFWRWANLSPQEKKALRDREDVRKKVVEQEVSAAIQETGLTLEGERREQFVKRYGEERRKIEEQLRKETMEKRKPMVKEVIARLKAEFSGSVSASTEPAAAPVKP